jgi:hypothetical protein
VPSWRWMTISGTPSRAIFDGMGVAELVRGKAPTHPGLAGDAAQLRAGGARRPRAPVRRAVDDAEQRADRQLDPGPEPRFKLFPGPVVHADLAARTALAAPHQQRSAPRVQVGPGERERLVDAQPGALQHDDQAAQPATVGRVAGVPQDGQSPRSWVDRPDSASPCCAATARRGTSVGWRVSDGGRRHRAIARTWALLRARIPHEPAHSCGAGRPPPRPP